MADVQPLRALRYDQRVVGPLDGVVAPPYDVIDAEQRARLAARSQHNIVHVDLPQAPLGGDPYDEAARVLERWRRQGALVRDERPAVWALRQEYVGPDGRGLHRHGILARVRIEEYGAGRIRPHERTHPGPKADRLALTRATRTNLSPIFSLYDDPQGDAWAAIAPHVVSDPWGVATDVEGTVHRLWRVDDGAAIARVTRALGPAELLIADGHHRYETARVYAEEVGGEGAHRYVLMCLVALQDPGLTVFPTHRLLSGLDDERRPRLHAALEASFDITDVTEAELRPPDGAGPLTLGWLDGADGRPQRLVLKDQSIADAALPGRPEAFRRLDTAVLEALLLMGALGMTEEAIAHLEGLGYSRTDGEAVELVRSGAYDAAFFLRASPVTQVREIAATGLTMPPKSTFFYPKVPTGLVLSPLA